MITNQHSKNFLGTHNHAGFHIMSTVPDQNHSPAPGFPTHVGMFSRRPSNFCAPKVDQMYTHTHIYIYKGTSSGKYYLYHQLYGVCVYMCVCACVCIICVIYCKFPAFFLVKPSYDCTVDLRSGSKVRPRQPNGPEALNLVCVSCDVNKILDASS